MNNDLKEQDLAYSGDPMFDDILRDLLALNTAQSQSSTDLTNNSQQNDDSNSSILLSEQSSL